MIAAVGDLLDDVVVHLHSEVHAASDTDATILHRRGGSAANVVAAACAAGHRARFIGQVGEDPAGSALVAALADDGAELIVRRGGRTGTIVVLVDDQGERTMLSDRGACTDLVDPQPEWLDGIAVLHVPYYSLVVEPLAGTVRRLAGWAAARGVPVSIDTSSAAVLLADGADVAIAKIAALRPTVVLANELEAAALGSSLHPSTVGAAVVVKRGAAPALVHVADEVHEVPAEPITRLRDSTGAGDAFAAGTLVALADGADLISAVRHGHLVAAAMLRARDAIAVRTRAPGADARPSR